MEHAEVVAVGAGVAGLAARSRLVAAGRAVHLIDKAERPGGRLSARRGPTATVAMGPATAHVDDPDVAELLAGWTVLVDGDADLADPPAVAAAALADGRVHTGLVTAVEPGPAGLAVVLDGGSRRTHAGAVLLTLPVPQTAALLARSGLPVPPQVAAATYARRWVLAVELDREVVPATPADEPPSAVGPAATVRAADGRAGPTRAVVASASTAWSAAHADTDATAVQAELLEEVHRRCPGARVVWSSAKRWRYAEVVVPVGGVSHLRLDGLPLWLAGDGFDPATSAVGGTPTGPGFRPPRRDRGVQRAVRSGIDAAAAILAAPGR